MQCLGKALFASFDVQFLIQLARYSQDFGVIASDRGSWLTQLAWTTRRWHDVPFVEKWGLDYSALKLQQQRQQT